MITKFKYELINGTVQRTKEFSFVPYEEIFEYVFELDNSKIVSNIIDNTIKGESERELIDAENEWYKLVKEIEYMDNKRKELEYKMANEENLTEEKQKAYLTQINDLKEGTIEIEKEFYDHYTRETYKVKETIQTTYTKKLESLLDIESEYKYLKAYRGLETTEQRPVFKIDETKLKMLKKLKVRKLIDIEIADEKDLIADISVALLAMIKKSNNQSLTEREERKLNKFIENQSKISSILDSSY